MATVTINSQSPDIFLPLLDIALKRERKILRHSIEKVSNRITLLSESLSVDPAALMAGEVPRSEKNEMDLIELEGEIEILKHLQQQLTEMESVTVCD